MDDSKRFSRQIPLLGSDGMKRIRESSVAIIGCGALGSAQAEMLSRAGVGHIKVIDKDVVEISNIHRTHMASEEDARSSTPKSLVCKRGIKEIDSSIRVDAFIEEFSPSNAEKLLKGVGLIVDGTDNMLSRYLINEASVKLGIPWIYAGIYSWYGSVMLIKPNEGPCFRCLMPDLEGAIRGAGRGSRENFIPSLGSVTTLVSSISSTIAIRLLSGLRVEGGVLYAIDASNMSIEAIRVERNPRCPTCVMHKYQFLK